MKFVLLVLLCFGMGDVECRTLTPEKTYEISQGEQCNTDGLAIFNKEVANPENIRIIEGFKARGGGGAVIGGCLPIPEDMEFVWSDLPEFTQLAIIQRLQGR